MLSEFLKSVFRFRKTNLSVLLSTTYIILWLLFAYDRSSYKFAAPSNNDFDGAPILLETAWLDLQVVTKGFHPYFTKDNTRVHDYLLNRVLNVTKAVPFAQVYDDMREKSSIALKRNDVFNPSSKIDRAYYFESANILAKIEGKNVELPGILLSAHYDSVPTSHGATDDGKGIVSLLGVLDYFSRHQPERTIVFNFNNNEEFGLLGAEAFMRHPWSKIVSYVINLEGTGTGSQAVLFRASDTALAKVYRNAVRKAPFGTSIYQQGFNDGSVRSQTDYAVYTNYGLRGLDIAFYKPRDLYHTIKDSIQYTSKEALWHMFHSTWQLTNYFSRNEEIDNGDLTPAIFFSVLGLKFFAFSVRTLFKYNCVILLAYPLLILIFNIAGQKNDKEKRSYWNVSVRLPLSFGISVAIAYLTQFALTTLNPFVLSRSYFLPLFAVAGAFSVANYLILSFMEYISPMQDFKTTIFHQVTILLWFVLLSSTITLYRNGYKETGAYICTFLYLLMSIGTILGRVCKIFKKAQIEEKNGTRKPLSSYGTDDNAGHSYEQSADEDLENAGSAEVATNDANSTTNGQNGLVEQSESELDERAPLLENRSPKVDSAAESKFKRIAIKSLNYDWSIQFLFVFPLATFIVFNALDLTLDAVHQTIQEDKIATAFTWNIVLIGGIALSLPLLPFLYKINYVLGLLLSSLFFISALLSIVLAPFTEEAPLKLRFSQEIDLSNKNEPIVAIYGRQGGFISSMLNDLPSIKQNNETVWCEDLSNGMENCFYRGLSPSLVDSDTFMGPNDLMSIKVLENDRTSPDRSLYAPINARFEVKVKQNRACSLWFNSLTQKDSPVRQVTIYKSWHYEKNETESEVIRINTGIDQLHLYKVDFDMPYYDIGVQWLPKIVTADPSNTIVEQEKGDEDILGVTIKCYWAEYETESIVSGEHYRKVPAFDELLEYAPINYSFANVDKGLVFISDEIKL